MNYSNTRPGYFVSGIGTDVGKTIVSALLTEALQADYWKPIQAGDLDHTDTQKVASLVSNSHSVFHRETYRLKTPMSPHAAAAKENRHIVLKDIQPPATERTLIVEGAGGLLVPLNDEDTMLDLIEQLALPVILVSRHYLGNINHTLLSIEALKSRGLAIAGLVFNGEEITDTERIIEVQGKIKVLGRIKMMDPLNATVIKNNIPRWKL